jgi:hypothetical protein
MRIARKRNQPFSSSYEPTMFGMAVAAGSMTTKAEISSESPSLLISIKGRQIFRLQSTFRSHRPPPSRSSSPPLASGALDAPPQIPIPPKMAEIVFNIRMQRFRFRDTYLSGVCISHRFDRLIMHIQAEGNALVELRLIHRYQHTEIKK